MRTPLLLVAGLIVAFFLSVVLIMRSLMSPPTPAARAAATATPITATPIPGMTTLLELKAYGDKSGAFVQPEPGDLQLFWAAGSPDPGQSCVLAAYVTTPGRGRTWTLVGTRAVPGSAEGTAMTAQGEPIVHDVPGGRYVLDVSSTCAWSASLDWRHP